MESKPVLEPLSKGIQTMSTQGKKSAASQQFEKLHKHY